MSKLLVICGPTATGKTKIALSLAEKIPVELISADSRQVYRGMDIGTGKDLPSDTVRGKPLEVTHDKRRFHLYPYLTGGTALWMLDVVEVAEPFSVSDYVPLATAVIHDIRIRNRLPLLVGGSGFFIRTLLHGIDTIGIPPDPKLRQQLKNISVDKLQQMVRSEHPEIWKNLNKSDRFNPHRLIRKIEIARAPDRKPSIAQRRNESGTDRLIIGLTAAYPAIYRRIDTRVDMRAVTGLEQEIHGLLASGASWDMQSMKSLGYKEWQPWFSGERPQTPQLMQEILRKWRFDEHAYARRQMTWFRRERQVIWFDITRKDTPDAIAEIILKWYTRK